MSRVVIGTVVTLLTMFAQSASGAEHLLDLSRTQGITTLSVRAGELLKVTIINLAPAASYDISVLTEIIQVSPLDPNALAARTFDSECAAFTRAKTLATEADETKVSETVRTIEDERKDCSGAEQREIDLRLGRTRQTIPAGTLLPGEQIRVVVKKNSQPSKTWVLVLTTGARGGWRALYGMALGPGDEEKFFAKAGEEPGKFVLTRERNGANEKSDIAAIPAVFFQWLPLNRELKDWAISPTLGIGVRTDRPAFFFGGVLTYNQNIGLVVGVPIYQEWKLRGAFEEGQMIAENLTEEQLHKRVFRFQRLFVAGVFRFGRNPFGGGDGDNKTEPTPQDPPRK